MVIQHNIPAINAHRQLGINNSNLAKNLEKLSSGYRINRAADDAAGLAISEKMRAQITGLNRAVLNAQDGASLIQTAEGALQEVHSMLNRMVELATQSANGTIQSDDRQKIESELEALKEEIDRISQATNFNGIALLDGSLSTSGSASIGASINKAEFSSNLSVTANATTATAAAATVTLATAAYASDGTADQKVSMVIDGNEYSFNISMGSDSILTVNGETFTMAGASSAEASEVANVLVNLLNQEGALKNKVDIAAATATITFTSTTPGKADAPVSTASIDKNGAVTSGLTATAAGEDKIAATGTLTASNSTDDVFEINGQKFAWIENTITAEELDAFTKAGVITDTDLDALAAKIQDATGLKVTGATDHFEITSGVSARNGAGGLTMQVGDTADDFNKITVSVDDMSSSGLGISNISMANQEAAARALDKVKAAIEKVSVNRGNLGALQNRLEHTINNLNVTSENMTAAESRIRDVDMAKEMMAFTKNNVLSQAAQAMLAQANQQPQQVLQLLR